MTPARNLDILKGRVLRTLLRLDRLSRGLSDGMAAAERRVAAYVTIETANTWASFARCYYISCVLLARRPGRSRVKLGVSGVSTLQDAIHFAVGTLRPSRVHANRLYHPIDEPSWHKPDTLLRLAIALKLSNLPEIQLALGLPTDAFSHLTVFRHFFAHRGESTARAAQTLAPKYGQASNIHPARILCGYPPGSTRNVLSDWITDVSLTTSYLCA